MPALVGLAGFVLLIALSFPARADSIPSGERTFGRAVTEPVYNDEQAGAIGYILTPEHAPDPVKANPRSWAPIYLPVYPVGSPVGTLLCQHAGGENCPSHGDLIAGLAQQVMPGVYGGGVLGHDHLIDFPGGRDFNVAWEPVVVLFTSTAAANEHLLTDDQVEEAVANGDAIEIPIPQATFYCAVVPARVYELGTPLA